MRLGMVPQFRAVAFVLLDPAQASPRTGGPQTDEHEEHQEESKAHEALVGEKVHEDVVRPIDEVGGP